MDNYYLVKGYTFKGYSSLSVVASEAPLIEAASLEGAIKVFGTPFVAVAKQFDWYYGTQLKTIIFAKGAIELPTYQNDHGIWYPTLVPRSAFWALPELDECFPGTKIVVHGEFAAPVTERTAFVKCAMRNQYYELDSKVGQRLRYFCEPDSYFLFEGRFLTALEIGELLNNRMSPEGDDLSIPE